MAAPSVAWSLIVACAVAFCQEVPSEDDMVLLQPYLDNTLLGDGIEAYKVEGVVLVPLGEICRLLAFGITVNSGRTSASGFFITPKRTFALDLDKGSVEVEGRKAALPRTARLPRDLYVDARSLGAWFPVEVTVLLKDSSLLLKAKEKLPIQALWERDSTYGTKPMARYGGEEGGPRGVYRPSGYAFMDLPMADVNLGLAHNAGPSSSTSAAGSATLGGDLFWMSSDLLANRDSKGSWISSRATLFREDPDAGILGPMRARRLDLGDLLNTPSMDLVGSLPQGRGLNIDNYPVTYRTRFATRTFRGGLTTGWSVEFYQNDSLVGFQRSRPDGLYEFQDVPLRFGVNIFRLVFHGPLGETWERNYRLDIAQDQPAPGTLYYGLSGVRPTPQAVGIASNLLTSSDLFPSTDIPTVSYTRPSYLAQANYGVSPVFSVHGGVAGLQLQDGSHAYESLGVRGVWSFLALQVSAAQDKGPGPKAGHAVEGILYTGYNYSTVTVRRDEFTNGFQRSIFDTTGLGATGYVVKDATGVDLNWSSKLFKVPVSLSAQVDGEDYEGGTKGTRERILLSAQVPGVTFTNSLSRLKLPNMTSPLQGTLTLTSFTRDWAWNGNFYYSQSQVNGWGVQGQYNAFSWQYQFGFRGPLGPSNAVGYTGPPQVSAGVTRMTGRFGLGFNVQRSNATTSANLQLQISLGREPRTGKWTTDAQSLATLGSVSAVAFLDTNGNGARDPGEPALPGARFKVSGSESTNQIHDPAVTFVTKLPRSQPVDISLDESSLEDPAQKAAVKTFTILPRPGKVNRIEFPVTTFGEINGTTRIRRGTARVELGGLELELLDAAGKRVKVLRSAYDGFYEFTDLPYGNYLLRVTPEEAVRVKIKPSERKIQIQANHNFLDGLDLVVEPLN